MNILVPKSMIFIPTLSWFFNNIFYGFKSEWIIPICFKNAKLASACIANALILCRFKGWKWLISSSWNKFDDNNSVMMHICLRKTMKSLILNKFLRFYISCYLIFINMFI